MSVKGELALVYGEIAADQVEQRGFPSAVWPEYAQNLASANLEADVVKHANRAERFAQFAPFKQHARSHRAGVGSSSAKS